MSSRHVLIALAGLLGFYACDPVYGREARTPPICGDRNNACAVVLVQRLYVQSAPGNSLDGTLRD